MQGTPSSTGTFPSNQKDPLKKLSMFGHLQHRCAKTVATICSLRTVGKMHSIAMIGLGSLGISMHYSLSAAKRFPNLVASLASFNLIYGFANLTVPKSIFDFFGVSEASLDKEKAVKALVDMFNVTTVSDKSIIINSYTKENARRALSLTCRDTYLTRRQFYTTLLRHALRTIDPNADNKIIEHKVSVSLSRIDFCFKEESAFKNKNIFESLLNFNWIVVTIGSGLSFLKEFQILDTAKIANQLGCKKGFQWLPRQKLEAWVGGLATLGFAGEAIKEYCVLKNATNKPLIRKEQYTRIAANISALVMNGFGLFNALSKSFKFSPVLVNLGLISTGALRLYRDISFSKREYFQ